ncbi:restriction endonuclease subunit S [Stenotrophomonas sp. Marseille-Q4652]|uniref:restriction endonuclease subunit S n=1 Tax=Stenotrophomonas sp. Marseille-Q4652 TaxID=2866595 RepID=UPI001CE43F89|nr:restriction endonuclease subunit S [Stenotrophomonas sp. Marseille-Q4652]
MSLPRYPEYKDSRVEWLGEVPAHWNVAPLKRFLDIENGADYKPVEADDGYPVLGSGGRFAFATNYIYDGESVLLGRKGTIDKPLYVTGRFWTVDTMYWSRIRSTACGRYCYYAATTIPFGLYSTNTALPSMTKGALDAHPMACPPLGEQHAISRFLDRETAKIDALIAEQEKLLALLAEKRQATISHAVTRGLDPNVPMKDSGIAWLGEVPAHWEVLPVKRVGQLKAGAGFPHEEQGLEDEELPFFKVAALSGADESDFLLPRGDSISRATASRLGAAIFPANTIVFAKVGAALLLGRIRKLSGEACIDNNLMALVVSEGHNSDFIRSALELVKFDLLANPGAVPSLNASQVGSWFVPCPPCAEQVRIARFLAEQKARFALLEGQCAQSIGLLIERRSAVISAAVTGQIDVRGLVEAGAS